MTRFAIVPEGVLRRISKDDLPIYVALAMHADLKKHECWPSWAALQEITGASRATIDRRLKSLRDAGLIEWSRAKGGVNRYRLLVPEGGLIRETGTRLTDETTPVSRMRPGTEKEQTRGTDHSAEPVERVRGRTPEPGLESEVKGDPLASTSRRSDYAPAVEDLGRFTVGGAGGLPKPMRAKLPPYCVKPGQRPASDGRVRQTGSRGDVTMHVLELPIGDDWVPVQRWEYEWGNDRRKR
jgi:DNA-binding transcriptional ArsR family regulator